RAPTARGSSRGTLRPPPPRGASFPSAKTRISVLPRCTRDHSERCLARFPSRFTFHEERRRAPRKKLDLAARSARLRKHARLGDRYDPAAAPFANVRRLLDDLVHDVPRPDEQVVGAGFANALGREDRNVRTRQEFALLVGVAIHDVVEKIRAD